ncbi:MAG: hypothetical protein EOO65_03210 [Methanosarcinales archaeon]|nr:MAG: hypothetical protein EOO65_03210 [Methanosarcinales archaeon]
MPPHELASIVIVLRMPDNHDFSTAPFQRFLVAPLLRAGLQVDAFEGVRDMKNQCRLFLRISARYDARIRHSINAYGGCVGTVQCAQRVRRGATSLDAPPLGERARTTCRYPGLRCIFLFDTLQCRAAAARSGAGPNAAAVVCVCTREG